MKCKIFSKLHHDLIEREINEWLNENPVQVQSITFRSAIANNGGFLYSVCLFYIPVK
jgi:hypothetical protein